MQNQLPTHFSEKFEFLKAYEPVPDVTFFNSLAVGILNFK